MRLCSWVVAMAALLTATAAMANGVFPPRTGGNYSGPRWYGYFFNNGLVSANADHTNITMIGAVELNDPNGVSDAIATIIPALKEAQDYGEKAMVDVEAIVFVETGAKGDACYNNNPTAVQDFQTFVTALEHPYPDQPEVHYLIPNDPVHSTVSSFYIADEPDRSCNGLLSDVPGEPSPALWNAISAIRGNTDTTNFPLATIMTKLTYTDMTVGIGLFDWVGEDDYGEDASTYMNDFLGFEYFARHNDSVGGTTQKYFMVPAVSRGAGSAGPYIGGAHLLDQELLADNRVIGIMPFAWDFHGGGMVGMSWAPEYIALGQSIATPHGVSPAEVTVIVDSVVLQ